jgi:hypothetical protein
MFQQQAIEHLKVLWSPGLPSLIFLGNFACEPINEFSLA